MVPGERALEGSAVPFVPPLRAESLGRNWCAGNRFIK